MITYFKDKNYKYKKKYEKYTLLTTVLKSFDTTVIFASIFSSITLSLTGFRLIVTRISSGIPCGLTISNKVWCEVVLQKYITYKKQYVKDQKVFKSFDKLNCKNLQDDLIDRSKMNLYVLNLLIIWMNQKMNLFYAYEHKRI